MDECGSVIILVSNKCAWTDAPFALRQTTLAQLTMSGIGLVGGTLLFLPLNRHTYYIQNIFISYVIRNQTLALDIATPFIYIYCVWKRLLSERDLQYHFIPTLHAAFAGKCQPFSVRGESQESHCDSPIAQSAALMLTCSTGMFFLKMI